MSGNLSNLQPLFQRLGSHLIIPVIPAHNIVAVNTLLHKSTELLLLTYKTTFLSIGWGAFTTKPFRKGDFLLEYVGERLVGADAINKRQEKHDRHKVKHPSCFMYHFKFDGKEIW